MKAGKVTTTLAKAQRKPRASNSVSKLDTIVESASKKAIKQADEAVAMLTVFGSGKSQSNEIFTVKKAKNMKSAKPVVALKQPIGFQKEYSGLSRVFDTSDHDMQEQKAALTSDAKSIMALFTGASAPHRDCNLIYITNRPSEIEQKR